MFKYVYIYMRTSTRRYNNVTGRTATRHTSVFSHLCMLV